MTLFPQVRSGLRAGLAARMATVLAAGLAVGLAAGLAAGLGGCQSESQQTASLSGVSPASTGTKAPEFRLVDLDGDEHVLSSYTADEKIVVLEWFNPGCPFVQKQYQSESKRMNELAAAYADRDVVWLRINSGAPGKQGHGRELNAKAARDWGIEGPILLDASGAVGRAYGAKTTPHMYVIDTEGVLRYAGAIDDNRMNPPGASDTVYVKQALDAILAGEEVPTPRTDPYGCSVKYSG